MGELVKKKINFQKSTQTNLNDAEKKLKMKENVVLIWFLKGIM